jgi:hypothetical protein
MWHRSAEGVKSGKMISKGSPNDRQQAHITAEFTALEGAPAVETPYMTRR